MFWTQTFDNSRLKSRRHFANPRQISQWIRFDIIHSYDWYVHKVLYFKDTIRLLFKHCTYINHFMKYDRENVCVLENNMPPFAIYICSLIGWMSGVCSVSTNQRARDIAFLFWSNENTFNKISKRKLTTRKSLAKINTRIYGRSLDVGKKN